ncbi:DUF898 family protein [Phenylobacterium sp.]|uniref:YjgN family protein n=1 Tax=Phenylobacterium sp. TaxID=1871053 RepID=UPI0030F42111
MSMSDDAAPARGESLVFGQNLKPGKFVGLSFKNGLLNIVTLTLYRFWAKTEVRRRIWNGVSLNGDAFEYTGRGRELFLGFLLALLLVVLPLLIVVFTAQFLAPKLAFLIILPVYLLLFYLMGFGRFTAFRYLASRTSWRGVRFALKGSPWRYAWSYIGNMLLIAITLGWFAPAAERRLAAPLWDGLRFGDREFKFDIDRARRVGLYAPFTLFWVSGVVLYGVFVALMVGRMATLMPETPSEPSLALIGFIYGALFVWVLIMTILSAPYQAAVLRTLAAGTSLEEARFSFKVGWIELAGLMLTNLLLVIFTLGFLTPVMEARTARFLIRRLRSEGLVDLAAARQAEQGPRTGEGLADAFGMATV